MPLVQHSPLPTLKHLQQDGHTVLSLEQACGQDIRELHIGLLNMMPDAALQVTEKQYLRLVGNSNQIAQFYVHLFTVPGLERGSEVQSYIDRFYRPFEEIQAEGLDALIITGANVTQPDLEREPFWEPLIQVAEWARRHVTSTMCSCLATHALVQHLYGQKRQPRQHKRWGVYNHYASRRYHPILHDINTRFDVPHSRWNAISLEQCQEAGLEVLIQSDQDDMHLAVSPDGFRLVFSQGHPEYHINSLLKEYKREVLRFLTGQLSDYPPVPEHYFNASALGVAERFRSLAEGGQEDLEFPEAEIERHLHNTWGDTGKAVFNNWLGLVYQLTHIDRHQPFKAGVDPERPLAGILRPGRGKPFRGEG